MPATGEDVTISMDNIKTGVTDINAAKPHGGQRYNLMGQPVGPDYRGLVIENGKKLIVK